MSDKFHDWQTKILDPALAKNPERQATFTTASGVPVERLYTPADLRRVAIARARPGLSRRVSLTPAASSRRCTAGGSGPCASTPGFGTAARVQRALPLPAGAGADRPLGRLRPADADGLRRRPPAGRGRGGQGRRLDRLARRHGTAVRRHPAGQGHHLDDDQRHGGASCWRSTSPSAQRAGRRPGQARRHGAERHPQGVHRARHVHLSAASRRCA